MRDAESPLICALLLSEYGSWRRRGAARCEESASTVLHDVGPERRLEMAPT